MRMLALRGGVILNVVSIMAIAQVTRSHREARRRPEAKENSRQKQLLPV